jgi:hypothetical protein
VTRGALNAALEPAPERKPSIDKSLTLWNISAEQLLELMARPLY